MTKNQKFSGRRLIAVLLIACSAFSAKASTDPTLVNALVGSAGHIAVNDSVTTCDTKFYAFPTSIEHTYFINNIITLAVDPSSPYRIQSNFTTSLTVQITATDSSGHDSVYNKTLEVSYDTAAGAKYNGIQYYAFQNAVKVKVKILSISSGAGWDTKQVLILKNELTATRDYKFVCATVIPSLHYDSLLTVGGIKPDEINVSWSDTAIGQTEYDLEWAWIDSSALSFFPSTGGNYIQKNIFENNATRVSITADNAHFKVPLLYDGGGIIFFRLRPVQMKQNGQRVEGSWTAQLDGTTSASFRGHEDSLNWQASTSFAEEGKHKSVVQYFDGTLRNRQTVTKDNTTGTTVVAESFYDYQGRSVMQVLPAPTLETIIHYAHNFNTATGGSGYPKNLYDKINPYQSICGVSGDSLSNSSGAAKYYSPNNPLLTTIGAAEYNKYIPDAAGYPFTETRYAPDGTGRVAAQGGVGLSHQLGSNHETKYYYQAADQRSELDPLFGTDAGIASHYFKTIVKDANGQYSISYTDMHGRTVATALAGNMPANLLPLPSYESASRSVTRNLLGDGINIIQGKSIIAAQSLVVLKDGPYHFCYHLTPDNLTLANCDTGSICYDCLYDLTIKIASDCDSSTIVRKKRNFSLNDYLNVCTGDHTSPAIVDTFTVTLNEGSYSVTKELRLSKDAQDHYRDSVFIPANQCKTLQDFINEEDSLLQANSNCHLTCDSCRAKLGSSYSDYRTRMLAQLAADSLTIDEIAALEPQFVKAYNEAKASCDMICNGNADNGYDYIQSIHDIMLIDMMPPAGQYARYNRPTGQSDPETGSSLPAKNFAELKYNIFNTTYSDNNTYGDSLSTTPPAWRNALWFNAVTDSLETENPYRDEFDQIDSVNAKIRNTDIIYSQEQFGDEFKNSWALSLLPHHPEYCKLRLLEDSLPSSFAFEALLNRTNDWHTAFDSGYMSLLVSHDPFFQLTGTSVFRDSMIRKIAGDYQMIGSCDSLSMWQIAVGSVMCRNVPSNNSGLCTDPQIVCMLSHPRTPASGDSTGGSCVDKDYAWKIFRSLYLSQRKIFISQYLNSTCGSLSSDPLFVDGTYRVRFPDLSAGLLINTGDAQLDQVLTDISHGDFTTGGQLLGDQADATCRSYASVWMTKLRKCPGINSVMNPVDSLDIINNLVGVCKKGYDATHPSGASSISPDSTAYNGYTAFPQVIKDYLISKGINPATALCHPYLIDVPAPYGATPSLSNSYVITKPTECECTRLHALQTEFNEPLNHTGTFSNYLLHTYGTNISQGKIDTLLALCAGDTLAGCIFLSQPITIPPVLQCSGPVKPCIDCKEFGQIKGDFYAEFHQFAPIQNPQTQDQLDLDEAFAAFANNRTGFSKLWTSYASFDTTCKAFYPPPAIDTTACDTLENILSGYHYSPSPSTPPSYMLGAYNFTDMAGYYYDHPRQRSLFTDGYLHMPDSLYAGIGYSSHSGCPGYDSIGVKNMSVWTDQYCHFNDSIIVNLKVKRKLFQCSDTDRIILPFKLYNDVGTLYNPVLYLRDSIISFGDTTAFSAAGIHNFNSWQNVSVHFGDSLMKVYINNIYITQRPCPIKPTKLQFGIRSHDNDVYADDIQIIDGYTGVRVVDDHFNYGEPAMQPADPRYVCYAGDCTAEFVSYFDSAYSSAYNYAQIDSLYRHKCNRQIDPCYKIPHITCDALKATATDYTTLFAPGNYALAWAYTAQDTLRDTSGVVFKTFPPVTLKDCIKNGIFGGYPDTLDHYHNGFYSVSLLGFQLSLNAGCAEPGRKFSVEVKTRLEPDFPTNFWMVYLWHMIYFANGESSFATNSYYYADPINFSQTGFANTGVSTVYTDTALIRNPDSLRLWHVTRYLVDTPKLSVYINGVLKHQTGFTRPVTKFGAFAFEQDWGVPEQVDYVRLLDSTGRIVWREEFNDPTAVSKIPFDLSCYKITCGDIGNGFTDFFNNRYNTSYSYSDIVNLYSSQCGIKLGTCDSAGTGPLLCGLSDPIGPDDSIHLPDPCGGIDSVAATIGEIRYQIYLDSMRNAFDTAYNNKCIKAGRLESFTVSYTNAEHHYTLYYYDQAGNLVQTVPPAGVDDHHGDSVFLDSVAAKRARVLNGADESANILIPTHTMVSAYRYNTLNQVIAQNTPDAGITDFYYDRLGRLVLSQNAKQAVNSNYSYTEYDQLGRIAQVGQIHADGPPSDPRDPEALQGWLNDYDANKEQITRTMYDVPYFAGEDPGTLEPVLYQKNLRNRVSYTQVFDAEPSGSDSTRYIGTHNSATFYSYDIHGNVDTLVQDFADESLFPNMMNTTGNRFKKMVYDYDLISGKVNMVSYQPGFTDEFYHKYSYDAENRITDVLTSHDKLLWEHDARYSYFKHGPLAKTIIGEEQVQGMDYAYTLQGWLKGVNSSSMFKGIYDMGKDGKPTGTSTPPLISRDAYGFNLNYFTNDYTPIGGVNPFLHSDIFKLENTDGDTTASPLFNGNIASMFINLPKIGEPQLTGYRYDQLNRLRSMDKFYDFNDSLNTWNSSPPPSAEEYQEKISYDANGNILTYRRNGDNARGTMDDLGYKYIDGTNKLDYVNDDATDASTGDYPNYNDIKQGQGGGNYTYDEIGNLITDVSETITNIDWSVYGKIRQIDKNDGSNPTVNINYTYDAAGNRISKQTSVIDLRQHDETWYVRDASGNVMSVYNNFFDPKAVTNSWHQSEIHLYGSNRLGIFNPKRNVESLGISNYFNQINTFTRGNKLFELSNHLGNVLATISDRRLEVDSGGVINHYNPDVITANDFYPFGMQMPGRKYDIGNGYRYGFNGKELDIDPIQYDYGFRIYDPRLGRFKSVDQLTKSYPWNSTYAFAENDVLRSIDLDGLEKITVNDGNKTITIKVTYAVFTNRQDKVIDGKTYGGGNIPQKCTNVCDIMNTSFTMLNAATAKEVYGLTFRTNLERTEVFTASDNPATNTDYKVQFDVNVLTFKDEEEMRNSEGYKKGVADGTFAGVVLFGQNSYAKTEEGKPEKPMELRKGDGALANGVSGTNSYHAILIGASNTDDFSTYVHEPGHNFGLDHITLGDNVVDAKAGANGLIYNTKGMMKGGVGSGSTPDAPFKSQLIKMINTLKTEIIPGTKK